MSKSPARPLIITALLMMPLFTLVALLPGNPDISSPRALLFSLALQALVAWRLIWHRSLIAWSLATLTPLLAVVSMVLGDFLHETTMIITCIIALLQFLLLLTPPVLTYVFREQAPAH
jgi:hypothetical protein